MLHSMTGFARQSADSKIGLLSWEMRAVNHRYLELSFRLPEELRPKEQTFRQQVGAILKRGKVDCSLHFRRAFDGQADMQLDTNLVRMLGKRTAEISAEIPESTALNPIDILRWPGVITEPEIDTASASIMVYQLEYYSAYEIVYRTDATSVNGSCFCFVVVARTCGLGAVRTCPRSLTAA